jgi:hypothetical protein
VKIPSLLGKSTSLGVLQRGQTIGRVRGSSAFCEPDTVKVPGTAYTLRLCPFVDPTALAQTCGAVTITAFTPTWEGFCLYRSFNEDTLVRSTPKGALMKSWYACLILMAAFPLIASSGPNDREVTEPKSVESVSNPEARPIPIDDLFFTRSVGGASWSPDGKEIVFTTNLAGRDNLWEVPASGGWPRQLSQSDDSPVRCRLVARWQVDSL